MTDLDQIALDTVEAIANIDPDKLKGGRVQAMAQAQCLVRDALRGVEAERDTALEQIIYWRERAVGAEAELDALSAHVERLRGALERIDDDLEGRNFLERSSLRDTARSALKATPATSLARIKAEWQMGAMEGWLIQVRHMEGLNTFDCLESAELYADELRRQAEGGS